VSFNLDNYEPVEDRLRRFWQDHPEGRILTELVEATDVRFIVRAEVYTDRDDARPAATGYAFEVITQRGVNATSALENGETSAVGRALANLNYAPKGARPSREEMEKASTRNAGPELDALLADLEATTDIPRLRWAFGVAKSLGRDDDAEAIRQRAEAVKA